MCVWVGGCVRESLMVDMPLCFNRDKKMTRALYTGEKMRQGQGLFSDLSYHNNYSSTTIQVAEAWCMHVCVVFLPGQMKVFHFVSFTHCEYC